MDLGSFFLNFLYMQTVHHCAYLYGACPSVLLSSVYVYVSSVYF